MAFSAPHSPSQPGLWARAAARATGSFLDVEEHKTDRDLDTGWQEGSEELEMKPRASEHSEGTANGDQQQDSGGSYDSMLWSRILDEQGDDAMALSADEDDGGDAQEDENGDRDHPELMTEDDGQAACHGEDSFDVALDHGSSYATQQSDFHDDSASIKMAAAAAFDHWGQHYDPELGLSTTALSDFGAALTLPTSSDAAPVSTNPPLASTFTCLPSSNLSAAYEGYAGSDDSHIGIAIDQQQASPRFMPGDTVWHRPHVLSFGPQANGSPFPLSKPLLRDDGVLLVGTEGTAIDSRGNRPKNRIFITNFLCSTSPMVPSTSHILVEQEVRDLQWLSANVAVAAVGNEIQLLHVGNGREQCRLLDPITTVHSDAIRETAVQTSTCSILSGGFDQTVVLTDLHDQHNPGAATIVSKYNAHDVVSSLRWSPSGSVFSLTTDGGGFKVIDTRARSSSVTVPLPNEYMVRMGGLYTHEYLGNSQVALGFERGQIACVDVRMPRAEPYSVITSSLATVGEIRRAKEHQSDKFALFGYGGFVTAQSSITEAKQVILDNLAPLQEHQIGIRQYKTSGDFSFENADYLAVTDNLGTVSLYNAVGAGSETTAFPPQQNSWRL